MFTETIFNTEKVAPAPAKPTGVDPKYRSVLQSADPTSSSSSTAPMRDYDALDVMLEKETQQNKNKPWNKLDKTQKIQRLHAYAEKYGKEHGLPAKDVKALKTFFVECLDSQKLLKTKEVIYNKDVRDITNIPALHFNATMHAFYLKNIDPKHVSTIKSLTPKRNTERNLEAVAESTL